LTSFINFGGKPTKDIALEQLNIFNAEMARLKAAYPNARIFVSRFVLTKPDTNGKSKATVEFRDSALSIGGGISRNKELTDRGRSYFEKNGYRHLSEYFEFGEDSGGHTVRHELGHTLTGGYALLNNGWNDIWRKYIADKNWIRYNVSEYAQIEPHEFIAEAFAMYTSEHYGKDGKRLPNDIEVFFDRVLNGKFKEFKE
jgi:hypothetical protein